MGRGRAQCVTAGLAAACLLAGGNLQAGEDTALKNWFGDPFFQVADTLPRCPQPLGPLLTESGMKSEAHSRAERGTTCWMAGDCRLPNAYHYDAAIAEAIRERMPAVHDANLWITVKRRFVWLEGCMADTSKVAELERLLKAVPDVEHVFVNVMKGSEGRPPYPALPRDKR